MSRFAVALLIAAMATGCGSVAGRAQPRTAALDGCVRLGPGARMVELRPAGEAAIAGVMVGTGPTTFVLSNESDENLCAWLPFAAALERHGYSALLYDYADPGALPAEARAAAEAARGAGARRVVLMGASVGARGSIKAAAIAPPAAAAVVSLSAERTVRSDPTDLVRSARHVHLPTLLISARNDPFVTGATGPLLKALAARHKRALIVPGLDHGTMLLTGAYGPRVRSAILTFVNRAAG